MSVLLDMFFVFFVLVVFGSDVSSYLICPSYEVAYKNTIRDNFHVKAISSIGEGNFNREVLDSSVPVIVDFYANWCGPCKAVAPVFSSVSEEFSESEIRFVTVDTDVHEETVDRYNIQGLPLFAIFKGGKVIATHSGALSKMKMIEFISKSIEM